MTNKVTEHVTIIRVNNNILTFVNLVRKKKELFGHVDMDILHGFQSMNLLFVKMGQKPVR